MNKQLVKIHQKHFASGELIQTVNARDLHAFLESKQQFADWIKARIEQYGFVENQDFTIHKIMNGRINQIDYHISLNMGKELSMVERNAKGKLARQYFIDCEHQAKQQPALKLPATYVEALEALLTSEKEKQAITHQCNRITHINEHLQERLGEAAKSATVLAVQIKTKKNFGWKPLKDFCTAQELELHKVHDPRYGSVWSYPAEAWQHAFGIDLSVLFAKEAAVDFGKGQGDE